MSGYYPLTGDAVEFDRWGCPVRGVIQFFLGKGYVQVRVTGEPPAESRLKAGGVAKVKWAALRPAPAAA